MIYRPTWIIVLAVALAVASIIVKGAAGFGLYLLGIAATALFLCASWRAIQLFTGFVEAGRKPLPTMMSLFIALGLKLPIFVILGLWLRHAEIALQSCFLLGLGLVYFWVVGWTIVRANEDTLTQNHGRD